MKRNCVLVLESLAILPAISTSDPSNSTGIMYKPIVIRVLVNSVEKIFSILLFWSKL